MNLKEMISRLDINADWIGLREYKENTTYHVIRDNNPLANETEIDHGVMVEVLKNGQFGYSGTSDISFNGIRKAADMALESAAKASDHSIFPFTKDVRPKSEGSYETPVELPFDSLSAGEINNILMRANDWLKIDDRIMSVTAMAMLVETNINYVCSNGSDISQRMNIVGSDYSATAKDGDIIQTRSDGRSGNQMGLERFNEDLVKERCEKVSSQVIELIEAEECPTGTMSLVLAPDQMMLQIHESIGHALEIDRILGDERNYAGWSFVGLEDFGNLKYGSDIMNITFDPTISNEMASYGFDDGGFKASKEHLIKDGILLRGLGALESQARSDIPAVANFRSCSWNRAPIDRMANLNLEPGASSFDDIISSVEYGVYMETNRSWSIDDYRNKFQFGSEYGKLIENGKVTKTLRDPNYRAITVPFWNSLTMVGDQSTFEVHGTPNCGKGEPNQVIRVGHASPTCLFNNIQVFGGA
jgi:predicted Zn-dependent protease